MSKLSVDHFFKNIDLFFCLDKYKMAETGKIGKKKRKRLVHNTFMPPGNIKSEKPINSKHFFELLNIPQVFKYIDIDRVKRPCHKVEEKIKLVEPGGRFPTPHQIDQISVKISHWTKILRFKWEEFLADLCEKHGYLSNEMTYEFPESEKSRNPEIQDETKEESKEDDIPAISLNSELLEQKKDNRLLYTAGGFLLFPIIKRLLTQAQ